MSTRIHQKVSTRIHPLTMSTKIRPFWKKVSTRSHCPRNISIPKIIMNLIQRRYRYVILRPKLPKLRSHYLLAVKFRKKKHFVGVVFYWDNFVERLSCHRDKWSFSTRKGFENFSPKIEIFQSFLWHVGMYYIKPRYSTKCKTSEKQ